MLNLYSGLGARSDIIKKYYKEQREEMLRRHNIPILSPQEEKKANQRFKRQQKKQEALMRIEYEKELAERAIRQKKTIDDFSKNNNIPEDVKGILFKSIFSDHTDSKEYNLEILGKIVGEKYPKLHNIILKFLESYIGSHLDGYQIVNYYKHSFEKFRPVKKIDRKSIIKKYVRDPNNCGENYQTKQISFKKKNNKVVSYARCYKIPKCKDCKKKK